MGQKANPIGLRVGIIRTWDSLWYAKGDYANKLHQDLKVRKLVKESLGNAGVSKIVIERSAKKIRIIIHAARPGMVIGKKGSDIEKLKQQVETLTANEASINIIEIRKPEIDACLIADNIAKQLEKRIAFRKAAKRAVQTAMRMGAKGIRVNVSGRLGGAEIARMEWYREGRVPLHTLRADIEYGTAEALTTYGIIGIKVWVYKGDVGSKDVLDKEKNKEKENEAKN
jgi:small subunit ribosomal protein S3